MIGANPKNSAGSLNISRAIGPVFDFLSAYTSPTFYRNDPGGSDVSERILRPVSKAEGNVNSRTGIISMSTLRSRTVPWRIRIFFFRGSLEKCKAGLLISSRISCVKKAISKSEHLLTLKNMTFAAPNAAQKLLKYPFDGIRLLLENQKAVEMNIKWMQYRRSHIPRF